MQKETLLVSRAAPPKVRPWKLRGRHFRTFLPPFIRHLIARWHAVALDDTLKQLNLLADSARARHAGFGQPRARQPNELALLVQANRHQKAQIFWERGIVLADSQSDDPKARKAWETSMQLADLMSKAAEHHQDGPSAICDIVTKKKIFFRCPEEPDIHGATFDEGAGAYITYAPDGKRLTMPQNMLIVGFANGTFLPV